MNSRALQAHIDKMHEEERNVHKLLLLGAGESGKSTLFKQMILLHGVGFSEDFRKECITVIWTNVVGSMKILIEQTDNLKGRVQSVDTTIAPSAQGSRHFIEDLKESASVDREVATHLATLWKDKGIQGTYTLRSMYQLTDSTKYFLDKVHIIGSPGWIPSEQDVLRSRVRTSGIVEEKFLIDGNTFRMFDVGGQRNERKKWIHCFSEVTAVIFVAALSEYDQVLYEDEEQNRMDEALALFGEICLVKWFAKTSMILMLNKADLFEDKIQKVPLTVCFPEYKGEPGDVEEGREFIKQKFEEKKGSPNRSLYVHFTCATNTELMRTIFNDVKNIVIKRSLVEGGLLTE